MASMLTYDDMHRQLTLKGWLMKLLESQKNIMQDTPQLENGHFHISNELFEAMISKFPCRIPGPFLIFMAVMRETYGFNRKSAEISTERFKKLTGIEHRNNIYRAIKEAIEYKLIKAIGNDGKRNTTYSINKKYDEWQKQSEMIVAIGNDGKSNRKRLRQQSEMIAVCMLKTPSKDTIKDNKDICEIHEGFNLTPGLKAFAIKKNIPEDQIQDWFDAFVNKYRSTGEKKKNWASAWFAYISAVAANNKKRFKPKNDSRKAGVQRTMEIFAQREHERQQQEKSGGCGFDADGEVLPS